MAPMISRRSTDFPVPADPVKKMFLPATTCFNISFCSSDRSTVGRGVGGLSFVKGIKSSSFHSNVGSGTLSADKDCPGGSAVYSNVREWYVLFLKHLTRVRFAWTRGPRYRFFLC